jgi:hypothetical protein
MEYDLGVFDDETCRLESAENPIGAKVLPTTGGRQHDTARARGGHKRTRSYAKRTHGLNARQAYAASQKK